MPISSNRPSAVVLLPAGVGVRALRTAERRWLAKGRAAQSRPGTEPLQRLLAALGRTAVDEGLAALRRWGQTGERPQGWMCGADAVYLEPRLDHLCLFALHDLDDPEFGSLIEELQARLAADRDYAFSSVGTCGYLASGQPMATAPVSAVTVHGELPDRFLPKGPGASAHDRLQGELQMCLHELALNRAREAAGKPPVNALWLWGGGRAPAAVRGERTLPVLFSDEPLTSGYWLAAGGRRAPWPGSIAACVEAASDAFVAVLPETGEAGDCLEALRRPFVRGELAALTLLFGDGMRVDLRRRDRLRFWRRELGAPGEESPP